MNCEACGVELAGSELALVAEPEATLPDGTRGVATLTAQICVACWEHLGKPLSCMVHRGRVLDPEEFLPLDMRPEVDHHSAQYLAAAAVDLNEEQQRAEALKAALNRFAVLTFHDPYSRASVTVHRDEWEDPVEISVALVHAVQELLALGSPAVDEILTRAGITFSAPTERRDPTP